MTSEFCTSIMSLVSVNQLIEKEKQRGYPQEFWRSKANYDHRVDEHTSGIFENCLIQTETDKLRFTNLHEKASDGIRSLRHPAHDLDFLRDTNEDAYNNENEITSIIKGDALIGSVDETDYFDSEDEYWENLREESIKSKYCVRCKKSHPPLNIINIIENEYIKSPLITPLVEKFAKENNFEIKDVYGDGNCLFRAVADQFMINGCPEHTELSLRDTAISYLRVNPAKHGIHTSSFLTGETWEDYLCRMEISGEWGDHIILQALAECFLLHVCIYNVANNDIRRTEVTATTNMDESIKFKIFLGYVGQSHYFSFRSLNWRLEIPYKSQIYRTLSVCSDKTPDERRKIVDSKLAFLSQGFSQSAYLTDSAQYVLQLISLEESAKTPNPKKQTDCKHEFMSYTGSVLQLEDTDDTRSHLFEDQNYIDTISGIPLTKLSFILKHITPFKMFRKQYSIPSPWYEFSGIQYHYLGSVEDEGSVILKDISWTQKASSTRTHKIPRFVVLKENIDAVFDIDDKTGEPFSDHLLVDCSDTKPGYCRLRLPSSVSCNNIDQVVKIGSNVYQKAYHISDTLQFEIKVGFEIKIRCIGVICKTSPFFRSLEERKRCDFPSQEIIRKIKETGCTLIPKSHGKSPFPDIEWQFNFSMSEHWIFKSLSNTQMHGYYVLKAMIECTVQYLPFKTKYLKAVFLLVCEEMPSRTWETNFSGCVLNVLGSLLSCLKARFLPSYFMPKSNLIDCLSEDDLNNLCCIFQYIREFPTNVIEMVGEKHGFKYAPNLIKRVLTVPKTFSTATSTDITFRDLLMPHSISTAKIMAKMGFYETSFDILEEAYEQSLLVSHADGRHRNENFPDFFMSALKEMKQRSSRFLLAGIFDTKIGSNMMEIIFENKEDCLQTHLPWTLDSRIRWLKYPKDNRDLTEIARFLYDHSIREYYRRNWLLAELFIDAAIRCIQELLKENSFDVDIKEDNVLKYEVDNQRRMVKRNLIHTTNIRGTYHVYTGTCIP